MDDLLENIEEYLSNIVEHDRLSGGEGESKAIDYIASELDKDNIKNTILYYDALISDPIESVLYYTNTEGKYKIESKTRSFSKSTNLEEVRGELIYLHEDKLIKSASEFNLKKDLLQLDLVGKIVISESLNPVSILEIEKRGAIGFINYWKGDEDLIHEGIYNLIWGMPNVNQLDYYIDIPIVCVNKRDGHRLIKEINNNIVVYMSTLLEKRIKKIPVLIAEINENSDRFLLLGNHIDSWYYGATDNGTGNALALAIAKKINSEKDRYSIGLKIAWWSGHSNGRYAGSSLYAVGKYKELNDSCLAYMNIDMPGLKGAYNYKRLSSGPDLIHIEKEAVKKLTGQDGKYFGKIRGWDQSFQNIGISPLMIWASTLEDGHEYSTAGTFMTWWWHTEKDILEYFDRDVLNMDAKIYYEVINNFLSKGLDSFNISNLIDKIIEIFENIKYMYSDLIDLDLIIDDLEKIRKTNICNADVKSENKLKIIRYLNRIYYSAKSSHLQDYSVDEGEIPGLVELLKIYDNIDDRFNKEILKNQIMIEKNRIIEILSILKILSNC
ncbi:MAG: M28 family peptidase [Tissierellia bacterium]|nr:M28 family peptidase [Tissierellia bacterium]